MADDQRLARVEAMLEALANTQEKILETMDTLTQAMIRNEDHQERIASLEKDHSDLKHYVEKRWYVLITVLAALAVLLDQIEKLL